MFNKHPMLQLEVAEQTLVQILYLTHFCLFV